MLGVAVAVRQREAPARRHPRIRAEVIAYDDFIKYQGEAGAKDAGKLRLEGKEG